MSDFQTPNGTYIAGGTINPGTFVTLSNDFTVVASATGDAPIGVSAQGTKKFDLTYLAASGDPVGVYGPSEECFLLCGGSVTAGDYLKPDANGAAVTASSTNKYGAIAKQDGSSGAMIRVLVAKGTV